MLDKGDELIKRAMKEHNLSRKLFEYVQVNIQNLTMIEKHLAEHIRFEERELFKKIEYVATEEQLWAIGNVKLEDVKTIESWKDEF